MGNCIAPAGGGEGGQDPRRKAEEEPGPDSKPGSSASKGSHKPAPDAEGDEAPPEEAATAPEGGAPNSFVLRAHHASPRPISAESCVFVGPGRGDRGALVGPAPPGTKSPPAPDPTLTAPKAAILARSLRRQLDSRLNRSNNRSSSSSRASNASGAVFYSLRSREQVTDYYDVAEKLGSGQFGEVAVAVHKLSGKRFAIKSMSKRKAEADPEFLRDIRREVAIMHQLGEHPNIVTLHEVYEDEDAIHLILELCEGGTWFQRLLDHGTYSEREAADTIRKLLQTLAYCHSLGVVHRDIKPENILLSDDSEDAAIKLADFGLSAIMPTASPDQAASSDQPFKGALSDAVGTSYYVAPEVLMNRGYDHRCDIWSLGVVLYIALGGMAPFDGANEEQILRNVMRARLRFDDPTWDEVSASAKDVIKKMLFKDPRKRATIPELLRHPWFNPPPEPESRGSSNRSLQAEPSMPDLVVRRLQQFAALNRYKKEARRMLAVFLPEEEILALLESFKSMDKDGDGVLTLAELHDAMNAKGGPYLPKEQAQHLLSCVDLNQNGVIDYEEFLAAAVHQMHLEKHDILLKAFHFFDHERCGWISVQELREAFIAQGAQMDAEAVLRSMGHDGLIDYAAFCKLMEKLEMEGSKNLGMSGARLLKLLSSCTNSSRPTNSSQASSQASRVRSAQRNRTTDQSGRFTPFDNQLYSSLGRISELPPLAEGGGGGGGHGGLLASSRSARRGTADMFDDLGLITRPGSLNGSPLGSKREGAVAAAVAGGLSPRGHAGGGGQTPRQWLDGVDLAYGRAGSLGRPSGQGSLSPEVSPTASAPKVPGRMLMRDASIRDKPTPGTAAGSRYARGSAPGSYAAAGSPTAAAAANDAAVAAGLLPAELPNTAFGRLSPLTQNYRSMLHQVSSSAYVAPPGPGVSPEASSLSSYRPSPATPPPLSPHYQTNNTFRMHHNNEYGVKGSAGSESSLSVQGNEASLDAWRASQLTDERSLTRAVSRSATSATKQQSRFARPS